MTERIQDKDFESYEDIITFPEEDWKHLYSIVWNEAKLAREAEKKWELARNYSPFQAQPCPLCIYKGGVFITSCNFHKTMEKLEKENTVLKHIISQGSSPAKNWAEAIKRGLNKETK